MVMDKFNKKVFTLLKRLEIYYDGRKNCDLAIQVHTLYSNITYPYSDLENIPDSTKGECTHCSAGLLSIDLDESFVITIYNKIFRFDVIVCDRCDNVYLEKQLSESDSLQIQED